MPFLTTDQILKQLMKFGFYITYDVKSNLPSNVITLLQEMYEIGYDKITVIMVKEFTTSKTTVFRPKVIVMKSEDNTDLLKYGVRITDKVFKDKLAANTIMNLSNEEDISWDWLTYIANISDLLDENIDPVDEYETKTDVEGGVDSGTDYGADGFTPYVDPDDEEDSNEVDPEVTDDPE